MEYENDDCNFRRHKAGYWGVSAMILRNIFGVSCTIGVHAVTDTRACAA